MSRRNIALILVAAALAATAAYWLNAPSRPPATIYRIDVAADGSGSPQCRCSRQHPSAAGSGTLDLPGTRQWRFAAVRSSPQYPSVAEHL